MQAFWKGHWIHRQSCQDLLKRDENTAVFLHNEIFLEILSVIRMKLKKVVAVLVYYDKNCIER